ncbi:MAG: FkbM family methyltransferase [Candidatus Sungbacteria bacterium]|nr:FkbM family methyltransferase [Candidatus Sungbacteria bacterium]
MRFSNWVKRIIAISFACFGLEIRKKGEWQRMSMRSVLRHAKRIGFSPATLVDAGAAFGDWTACAHSVFPDARYVLIEPLTEYRPVLEAVCQSLKSSRLISGAAAGPDTSQIAINVHKDLVGSSIFEEVEDEETLVQEKRVVPAYTLDDLCADELPPFLLKLDLQGAELEALRGGKRTLARTDMVILEVSFFRAIRTAPLFHEVTAFMKDTGFVAYDIAGISYRPLDGALCQADVAFVRETGIFRISDAYAAPEQRERQNAKFVRERRRRLACIGDGHNQTE